MRIPLAAPDLTDADINAVAVVLRTPWLSLGPKLEEFERRMAEHTGSPHAIAVSSGTAGLHLCMRVIGIEDGDEVIVPSFAFIAVANVVRYERGIPVFVDIDPVTMNLKPDLIEAALTPRTRAIIMVHTFGCPAEIAEIIAIARRHRLFVIEDGCEAVGAEYDGRKVGTHGDAGVFGFYPNKQITTGEGGMIVTADSEMAAFARKLRNQGRSECEDGFDHQELGYNYRIPEMNCALGIEQLKRLGDILEKRETIARQYDERLRDNPNLVLPPISLPRRRISWFCYVVRLSSQFSRQDRDWIWKEMLSQGIGCGRYFAPIHRQPIYQTSCSRTAALAVTESVADRTLALPFFNRIEEEQIDQVCATLHELVCRMPQNSS
jgi:perosamine synthetase